MDSRASETRARVKIGPISLPTALVSFLLPEEKWGTTCSLPLYYNEGSTHFFSVKVSVGFGAEKCYLRFQARIRTLMKHESWIKFRELRVQ